MCTGEPYTLHVPCVYAKPHHLSRPGRHSWPIHVFLQRHIWSLVTVFGTFSPCQLPPQVVGPSLAWIHSYSQGHCADLRPRSASWDSGCLWFTFPWTRGTILGSPMCHRDRLLSALPTRACYNPRMSQVGL